MKLYVKLLFLVGGWWVGQKKTKLMLYLTLVEIEVEVGVELGNNWATVTLTQNPSNDHKKYTNVDESC